MLCSSLSVATNELCVVQPRGMQRTITMEHSVQYLAFARSRVMLVCLSDDVFILRGMFGKMNEEKI